MENIGKCSDIYGIRGGVTLKCLSLAAIAGCAIVSSPQAFADENMQTYNYTPTLGENSSYTVNEVSSQSANSIITYEVIGETSVPHYYDINVKPSTNNSSLIFTETPENCIISQDFINVTGHSGEMSLPALNITTSNNNGELQLQSSEIQITGDFINNPNGAINSVIGYDEDEGKDYTGVDSITVTGNYINNGGWVLNIGEDNAAFFGTSNIHFGVVSAILVNAKDANFYNNYGKPIVTGFGGNIVNSKFINNTVDVDKSFSVDYSDIISTKGEAIKDVGIFKILSALPMAGGGITSIVTLNNVSDSYFENNSTTDNGGAISNLGLQTPIKSVIQDVFFSAGGLAGVEIKNCNIVDDDGNIVASGKILTSGSENYESIDSLMGNITSPDSNLSPQLVDALGELIRPDKNTPIDASEVITVKLSDLKSNTQASEDTDYTDAEILEKFLIDDEKFSTTHQMEITNSIFIGNHATSKNNHIAKGGAIYTNEDLTVNATDGKYTIFKGNYTLNNGIKDSNAIHMGSQLEVSLEPLISGNSEEPIIPGQMTPTTLTLNATNNGKIFIYDKISGDNGIGKGYLDASAVNESNGANELLDSLKIVVTDVDTTQHYNIDIKGDETGSVYLFNDVENSPNISLTSTNLYLGRDNVIDNSYLTLNSGFLSMCNNQVGVSALNKLTLNGDTNFVADVDLANEQMDRFVANAYGEHNGTLNVIGMNLLNDMKEGQDLAEIYFAQQGLKNNVKYSAGELPHNVQTTFYTPIYKYNALYDNREDAGYFVFARGDKILTPGGGTVSTGNPSDKFNPTVLASPVAAQAGATATMNTVMNYAFQNSADFMNIPYLERVAKLRTNRYALSPTGDATDVGTFSPLFIKNEDQSVWVKPYATFENVPLKNGPKVTNNTYGTLVGFDSNIKELRRGWSRVWTGYIGYNGASQRYSGISSYLNGGLVGGTMTMYKGNFFNATTLSTGAIVGENHNMYGNENYTMLMAGVGNKTGYNYEFNEGKLIVQPSLLLSYTFVNTFDYKNAAGVKINSDPLHAIQISPGVKVIGNIKGGWQPYASVNMVWNLMGESHSTANGVALPEMSIKPYVQYGVGVQKRIKDNFMAYGQTMIQNGGRNGISLTAGFRWALGHDGKPIEKVQKNNLNKTASVNNTRHSGLDSKAGKIFRNEFGMTDSVQKDKNMPDGEVLVEPARKVLKQLTPAQKIALGAKQQNTTRTTLVGSMKQL